MIIDSKYIEEFESMYLPNGASFDAERRNFITHNETCDLLAVPGSGKTTALMAKLYCLSKSMPINNASGILVLSHTNSAIEDIENKLKPTCPNLFQYPNFVGTVQSFVNHYLAYPHFTNTIKRRPQSIDEQLYRYEVSKKIFRLDCDSSYLKNRNPQLFFNARIWFNQKDEQILSNGLTEEQITFDAPNKWVTQGNSTARVKAVIAVIGKIKKELLHSGILHFDDAYYLARCFISRYPEILNILQQNFEAVFVDETQDLEKYQLDIIDSIFHQEGSKTIIQRIGDINQSIYNSGKSIKEDCNWQPRNQMYLNNSLRLTAEVANVVDPFTLHRSPNNDGISFRVVGTNVLESTIKPHLVLFDKSTTHLLKPKFIELIESFRLNVDSRNLSNGYKIIGWNGTWKDEEDRKGRLRLEDIFSKEYTQKKTVKKSQYSSLSECLQFVESAGRLGVYQNNILSGLCTILRVAAIKDVVNGKERYYNYQSLFRYIVAQSNNPGNIITKASANTLKSNLYLWSLAIATQANVDDVYSQIKTFITTDFKIWFNINDAIITEFAGDKYVPMIISVPEDAKEQSPIKIDIETVHSAKGKTHCATMYIETSYFNYESKKLELKKSPATKRRAAEFYKNPLFDEEHNYGTTSCKRAKETMKMMYVGFSRPTHLLCFAILKNNCASAPAFIDRGWEVVDLTETTDETEVKQLLE